MNEDNSRIGIDYHQGQYYAARVSDDSGRAEVKALLRFDREHFGNHPLLKGKKYIFSIPDDKIIIKRFELDPNEPDFDIKTVFEMSQRIGEKSDAFLFDKIRTGLNNNYLGLAVRKIYFEQIKKDLKLEDQTEIDLTGGMMRTVALSRGYLNFCRIPEGDLKCLVEFGNAGLSAAFLYKRNIIELTQMKIGLNKNYNGSDFEKIVIELKTTVDYKLSTFFKDGITIPLAGMTVTGEDIDDNKLSIIGKYFQIPISRPELNPGFFSKQENDSKLPLENYLTALGLTVN